jgi:hypothetical protein
MPTEPNLTDELSDVETLLKQYSPAASTIDRDTLMYQAGFTAGEARTRKTAHLLWPATTVALAASLLMLLASPPENPIQQASIQPEQLPESIAEQRGPVAKSLSRNPKTPSPKPSPVNGGGRLGIGSEPKDVRAARVPLKGYFSTAPMMVMRERALRGDFGDRPAEAEFDTWPQSSGPQPGAFTNRQLLREFLPVLPEPSLGGNS